MMRRDLRLRRTRRGAVLPLVALLIVFMLGMVAFAVDLCYIAKVRAELQRASDAAALAATAKLLDKDELAGAANATEEATAAGTEAVTFAAANPAGGVTLALPGTDVQVGYVNDTAYPVQVDTNSSSSPNAVKVTVRRDETANGKLPLFFANVLGKDLMGLSATSIAVYEKAIRGFKATTTTGNSFLLPYTLKKSDWDDAFTSGSDEYTRTDDGDVSLGGDGIREVKLFPLDNGAGGGGVAPGNFGTVDIGSASNSTSDLERQILYGPDANDFSYMPGGEILLGDDGTLLLNGDTGVSSGVKDELAAIKGEPRIIPLYTTVVDNGNNAQFTIVEWVGVTILHVKLTGGLASKYVLVQPCFVVDPTAVSGDTGSSSKFVMRPLALIE